MTGFHAHRWAVAAAIGLLALPLAACDSQSKAKDERPHAEQALCGVQLTSAARTALSDLIGARTFRTSGSDHAVHDAAAKLTATSASPSPEYEFCTAYSPSAESRQTYLTFSKPTEVVKDPSPEFTRYKLGELALSRPRDASMYLRCSSSALGTDAVLIVADLTNMHLPTSSDSTARVENLRVLHAASLALVREMRCKNDAGLPEHFSMPPQA